MTTTTMTTTMTCRVCGEQESDPERHCARCGNVQCHHCTAGRILFADGCCRCSPTAIAGGAAWLRAEFRESMERFFAPVPPYTAPASFPSGGYVGTLRSYNTAGERKY